MRHSEILALVSAAALGVGALVFGRYVAAEIEGGLEARTLDKLSVIGYPDLAIDVDGMVLEVSGSIDTEKDREILLATLESMPGVDSVVDNLVLVSPLVELQPASIFIQKDAEAITLGGEAPNAASLDLLSARAELATGSAEFINVMKAQNRRAPDAWLSAAEAVIDAVAALKVGQATVERGLVRVVGAAPDAEAKDEIAARLQASVDPTFSLKVEITAPPPLLSPYVFSARKTEAKGLEITRCAAPDARLRSVILGELKSRRAPAANVAAAGDICVVANGAPNEAWIDAVLRAIAVVDALPEGEVRIVDDAATVEGYLGEGVEIEPSRFQAQRGWPPAYSASVSLQAVPQVVSPYTFTAVKRLDDAEVSGYAPNRDRAASWADRIDAASRLEIARGAPPGWSDAVEALLDALADQPVGAITIEDAEAIFAAPGDARDLAVLADRLRARVPPSFSLRLIEAHMPAMVEARPITASAEGPGRAPSATLDPDVYSFTARKREDGSVEIQGVVGDDVQMRHVSVFARARLGGADMTESLVIGAVEPPFGWESALFSGILSLSDLDHGEMVASPGQLTLRGVVSEAEMVGVVQDQFESRAPEEYEPAVEITFAAPTPEIAPPPAEFLSAAACVAELNAIVQATPIEFPTGEDTMRTESYAVINEIIEVLRRCPDARIEVGAHTDSVGSDEINLELSQGRARVVRYQMVQKGGMDDANVVAVGYGETAPIADNSTQAGQAKNRRIEFKLLE